MHEMCDALRDLVPFVQFKKHEKHQWRSVNFSKVAADIWRLKESYEVVIWNVFW